MVKLSVTRASNLATRTRGGVIACGLAAWLGGCADDPFPAVTADQCILVCALVRAVTGTTDPAPPASATKPVKLAHTAHHPAKPVAKHLAHAEPRPVRRPANDIEPPARTVPETPDTGSTTEPQSRTTAPVDPPQARDSLTQLPGSAQIEENTSRFEPLLTGEN